MTNPYLRAAARNEALRLQALEKLQAREAEAIQVVDVQVIERARDPETGQFLADDPATLDVDEAWVPAE
jgi:hypothetical protein